MRKIVLCVGLAAVLTAGCELATEPVPVQPAEEDQKAAGGGGGESADGGTAEPVPIKLQAKRAKARKSMLSTGDPLSCVKVTVTNQTEENLEVNPLYFSLTDTENSKHDTTTALGEYEDQIAATTLAPGENTTGIVCARGEFRPKIVAMTNPLLSEAARAKVSS
ncbi:DUF4352 domain-containing protein [Spirillospora sp. NPDC052242]